MLAAQVIGSSADPTSHTLFINRGEHDRLRMNMGVVTPDGIVGKIVEVLPDTAQVLLINDKDSGVGALFSATRTHGVVRGSGDPEPRMDYVVNDEKVQPGDAIVTSGEDRIFPKDFPIGTVESCEAGQPVSDDSRAAERAAGPAGRGAGAALAAGSSVQEAGSSGSAAGAQTRRRPRKRRQRILLRLRNEMAYMLNVGERSDPNVEVHKFYGGAVLAVCLLALVFQAFLHKYGRWSELIDLPLLVTIYFGVSRRNPVTGLFLGGTIGILQDALSHDNPIGMYGIAKTMVGYLASSIGGRIDTEHPLSRFALVFCLLPFSPDRAGDYAARAVESLGAAVHAAAVPGFAGHRGIRRAAVCIAGPLAQAFLICFADHSHGSRSRKDCELLRLLRTAYRRSRDN